MTEGYANLPPFLKERDTMIRCLNLGCGDNIRPSTGEVTWINLDREARTGVDIAADLEQGLPQFESELFDFVVALHVLEHIHNFLPLMREIHRVLKPGGTLVIKVPEFPCRAAVADPTHVRNFVPESFFHFVAHHGFDTGGMTGMFQLAWLESEAHDRMVLDRGVIGSYFTELHCELIKVAA